MEAAALLFALFISASTHSIADNQKQVTLTAVNERGQYVHAKCYVTSDENHYVWSGNFTNISTDSETTITCRHPWMKDGVRTINGAPGRDVVVLMRGA